REEPNQYVMASLRRRRAWRSRSAAHWAVIGVVAVVDRLDSIIDCQMDDRKIQGGDRRWVAGGFNRLLGNLVPGSNWIVRLCLRGENACEENQSEPTFYCFLHDCYLSLGRISPEGSTLAREHARSKYSGP